MFLLLTHLLLLLELLPSGQFIPRINPNPWCGVIIVIDHTALKLHTENYKVNLKIKFYKVFATKTAKECKRQKDWISHNEFYWYRVFSFLIIPTQKDVIFVFSCIFLYGFIRYSHGLFHRNNQWMWDMDIVYSGASNHVTSHWHLFSSIIPSYNRFVTTTYGTSSQDLGFGFISLSLTLCLKDVLHVLTLSRNLISISQITKNSFYGSLFASNSYMF